MIRKPIIIHLIAIVLSGIVLGTFTKVTPINPDAIANIDKRTLENTKKINELARDIKLLQNTHNQITR